MIGTDGKTTGFPVKGGRRYSFSIEVRGCVPSVGLSAKAWNEGLWKDSVNLKTNLKDVPVMGDWTLYRGSVDVPDGKAHLAFIAETCSNGGSVWHYTCSTSGRAPIYETYRLHPWFGWAHRLTGNQFFIFQEMTGGFGPYDFKCAMSSGIAYRNFNVTMPSLRYMALRRGVYDVKYLEALAAAKGGDPDVKAFLERAPMEVLQNRHDTSTPDRIRDGAIRLLLQTQFVK